jgi:surface protein
MESMFYNSSQSFFNADISGWKVSNVTSMADMFGGCFAFDFNLSGWNTSAVTNMSGMFAGCSAFTSNISGWNVAAVTNMSRMFYGASLFNSNISGWNVGNVVLMTDMFNGASSFVQNIGGWDFTKVTDFGSFIYYNTGYSLVDSSYNVISNLSKVSTLVISLGNNTTFANKNVTYSIDSNGVGGVGSGGVGRRDGGYEKRW